MSQQPIPFVAPQPGQRLACVVDVETTGLGADDEVIELALVLFAFDDVGQVAGIVDQYCALQQPTRPIPAEATTVNGITRSSSSPTMRHSISASSPP
jgi:DNA polymerase III subunit epsilon